MMQVEELINLYIVEDLKGDAEELVKSCAGLDWLKTVVIASAEEAVKKASKKAPDVLSLDLLLGSAFLGYWTLEKVRAVDPTIGIVVVSEYPEQKAIAAKRNVDSFITKEQVKNDPEIYLTAIKRAARRKVQSSLVRSFENIIAMDAKLGEELVGFVTELDLAQYKEALFEKTKQKSIPEGIRENLSRVLASLLKGPHVQLDMPTVATAFLHKKTITRPVSCELPDRSKINDEIPFKIEIKPVTGVSCPGGGFLTLKKEETCVDVIIHGDGFDIPQARATLKVPPESKSLIHTVPVRPIKAGRLRLLAEFYSSGARVGCVWAETLVED